MKLKQAENGKLDLVVDYRPEFEYADLYPTRLESMKARAEHYLKISATKTEKKLARDLSNAVCWIEREIWSLQEKERMKKRTVQDVWEEHEKGCPVPECPVGEPWRPKRPDPRCRCGKPLMIVIRPGEHIHPCTVHPERVVYGPPITW